VVGRARGFCGIVLAILATSTAVLGGDPAVDPTVLRVEDIVRWHVAGVPEADLVRRIESAAVDFELDDEMVTELRLAGVPEAVLRAMAARQADLHPPAAPPSDASAATPLPSAALVIALRGQESDAAPRLRLPTRVPPELAAQLALEDPEARVTDLAIYVACVRAPHVPSHWRAASPLGRDFASMPRHEMLAFVPLGPESSADGEAPAEADPGRKIDVEAPQRIEVTLDPEDEHDLSIGLAVRIGDRYYRITSDTWDGLVPRDQPDGLQVVVESGGSAAGLRLRFTRSDATAARGT